MRAWNSKCASLSQEVFRRLQNTANHLPLEESTRALEEFSLKLTRYGYMGVQSRSILESGIRGFMTKLASARELGETKEPIKDEGANTNHFYLRPQDQGGVLATKMKEKEMELRGVSRKVIRIVD